MGQEKGWGTLQLNLLPRLPVACHLSTVHSAVCLSFWRIGCCSGDYIRSSLAACLTLSTTALCCLSISSCSGDYICSRLLLLIVACALK